MNREGSKNEQQTNLKDLNLDISINNKNSQSEEESNNFDECVKKLEIN